MATKTNEFEYKAEMKRLLDIIINSLYTNPEIFLRELVSNSADALNKIRFRKLTDEDIIDPDLELSIKIEVDEEKKTFSIEDTGIGMTKKDLINRIGTIASSGTLEFLNEAQKQSKKVDPELIGRFGVGFYSAFIVTDEITIETLYADKGSTGYRWKSKGEEKFEIEEISRKKRGTKIYFTFKDEHKEFANVEIIKGILKKYSNFVNFPIYVNGEEVNRVTALWHRKKEDIKEDELKEFYKFISNDFQEPLGHLHFSIEGNVNFKALLFIPKSAPQTPFADFMEKTVNLYSHRVFIQDDCKEILPDYLKFVKGVVDTEDLPLNISRETTQSSPLIAKIRHVLTKKILSLLEDWTKKDKEKYEKFHSEFGQMFKTGVNSDFANKDRIVELLRYETSELPRGKFKSLKEYVSSMQSDQNEIYYIMGDSRELIEKNPNLEYFKKKGLEVIYLTDPVDVFTFPYIQEYDGKKFVSIEKADIDISDDEEIKKESLDKEKSSSLLEFFKKKLGDKVEGVIESKRLVDSPASLVVGKKGMDPQMERMMQYMDKNYQSSKKVLEVNTAHPLIKNLAKLYEQDKNSEVLENSIIQLFEGAVLLEGKLDSPADYVKRMTDFMTTAIENKI